MPTLSLTAHPSTAYHHSTPRAVQPSRSSFARRQQPQFPAADRFRKKEKKLFINKYVLPRIIASHTFQSQTDTTRRIMRASSGQTQYIYMGC